MGNEGSSRVAGKGNIELIFTPGKKVLLTNVLHVPDMTRDMASGYLLSKPKIKAVYEVGKLILTKNENFMG